MQKARALCQIFRHNTRAFRTFFICLEPTCLLHNYLLLPNNAW